MDLKNLDIKAEVEKLVAKAKDDKGFMDKLKSDPVKAVESFLGVDLPDEAIKKIVEGVKAKISLDKLGGIVDMFKK
ncbi:MAG: hypothetical protein MJ075_00140 [Oscillospiraceae bacterium]|nr:hypothetical protein [Oscillospiraceae bacterium]